jgi:hypothetical protein
MTPTPTHTKGDLWTPEKVQAFLSHHKTPAAAARAAGISRHAFHEAAVYHGIMRRASAAADPSQRKGGTMTSVYVKLRSDQAAWLRQHPAGERSEVVRRGLQALMAWDRIALTPTPGPREGISVALMPAMHAWLNAHGRGKRSALVQQAVDLVMGG